MTYSHIHCKTPNASLPRALRSALPAAIGLFLFVAPALAPAAVAYPVTDTTFSGGAANATLVFNPGTSLLNGPSFRLLANATYTDASIDVEGARLSTADNQTLTSDNDFNAGQERTHIQVSGFSNSMFLQSTTGVSVYNSSTQFGSGVHAGTAEVGGRIVLSGGLTGTYTTQNVTSNGAPWGLLFADGVVVAPSSLTFNLLDPNDAVLAAGLQSGSRIPIALSDYSVLKFQLVLTATATSRSPEIVSFGFGARAADYLVGNAVARTATSTENVGDLVRTLPAAGTLNKDATNVTIDASGASYSATYLSDPFVVLVNGTYWMYLAVGGGQGIARATSTDTRNWNASANLLLAPTAATYDSAAVLEPYVFADPEGPGYIMLYTAWDSATFQIARATSPDGIAWTKTGPVLSPSGSGWDAASVAAVALVDYNASSDTYLLYYSGSAASNGSDMDLGRATSSDGISWTRETGNPVLTREMGGPDQYSARGGKIASWGGTLFYYYSCSNETARSCLAASTDGANWSKSGVVINVSASSFDTLYATAPAPVRAANGTLMVFFAGGDGANGRIGRAVAPFQAGEWTGRFELLAGPTPDWVSFTKSGSNPVIPVVASTYYSGYLSQPQVVPMGASWWMYMSAGQGPGPAGASIARATSNDLVTWTMDAQPLLTPTAGTSDASGMLHPFVLESPFAPGYLMYYTAVSNTSRMTMAMATSPDGLSWTKVGTVYNGSGLTWDAVGVTAAAFIQWNSTADRLRMWYGGIDATGAVSTGIASSPDGRNWTRITDTPALAHGGLGSPDQDRAQGGKIVDLRGTMALYYTCDPGNGKRNTCLATSITGGFQFIKRGLVLNASASGFDDTFAADPAPVLTADHLYLFFAGSSGSTSQIGLADGAFDPSAPGAWLGRAQELPRSITNFAATGAAGAGATLSYAVRSSADGVSWSGYEGVSSNDNMVFTSAQRFVQYRVQFTAGSTPSTFDSAAFTFNTYYESGRYRSERLAMSGPIDRVFIDASVQGAGRVDWYAEVEGVGTVATPLRRWVDTPGGAQGVVVRADFFGAPSSTPQVFDFNIRVQSDGLPSDVALRVGAGGPPRFASTGNLTTITRVSIPGADFQNALAAALVLNPALTSVDIILNVTSTHFGIVKLTNLTLNYTLKNPIAATYSPAAASFSSFEGSPINFSVAATTCCGATISYEWFIDAVLVASPDGVSLTWMPTYDHQGPHVVAVRMSNGDSVVTRTWSITVLNVDRPPVILSSTPAADATFSYTSAIAFAVDVMDPDGDAVWFDWEADGDHVDATSNETVLSGLGAGVHNITMTVTGASIGTSFTWLITLTDSPPVGTFTPDSPVTFRHSVAQRFEATVTDPDGDMVSYRWTVGGQPRPETTPSLLVQVSAEGSFTVVLVVTGGTASATHQWEATATDEPPVGEFSPATPFSVSHASSLVLYANGSDPDGDDISYRWFVDGTVVSTALSSSYTFAALRAGTFNITVHVLAGVRSATHGWTITATNAVPAIGTTTPSGTTGAPTRDAQSFSVSATDGDGDPLTFAWAVDGTARPGTTSNFNLAAGLAAGPHTVTVTVTDGFGGSTTHSWTFTVPAGGEGGGLGGSLLPIMLIVLGAAGAGIFLFLRARKKQGPEPPPGPGP